MAPDETIMTLWPSFLSFTAVSTIDVRMERRGSWLFSSTIELVPEKSACLSASGSPVRLATPTPAAACFFCLTPNSGESDPLTKLDDNP